MNKQEKKVELTSRTFLFANIKASNSLHMSTKTASSDLVSIMLMNSSWAVGFLMMDLLNKPGASSKFTYLPLPDEGDGIGRETVNSQEVASGVCEF